MSRAKVLSANGCETRSPSLSVSEIGYLPVTESGGDLFFQPNNGRYGCGATILTSNKGLEGCGRILGDGITTAAVVRSFALQVPRLQKNSLKYLN